MRALGLAALVALAVVGCSRQGHDDEAPDLAVAADLSVAPDLAMPDLKGPSCGQIFLCLLQQCQLTNLMCDQMCFQGAQPQALEQVGALAICAGINCLQGALGDGGLGGGGIGGAAFLQVIQCIESKCPNQTNACEDLPFAGNPPM